MASGGDAPVILTVSKDETLKCLGFLIRPRRGHSKNPMRQGFTLPLRLGVVRTLNSVLQKLPYQAVKD
jgi:hypothetical protein